MGEDFFRRFPGFNSGRGLLETSPDHRESVMIPVGNRLIFGDLFRLCRPQSRVVTELPHAALEANETARMRFERFGDFPAKH